jgi:hypothetical protein
VYNILLFHARMKQIQHVCICKKCAGTEKLFGISESRRMVSETVYTIPLAKYSSMKLNTS